MPSVFISYSHESEEHRARVVNLAAALLAAGWDVRLDRYVGHPSEGWPRWMADQIEQANRILCICTPTYRDRFNGEQSKGGLGVYWEGYLLTGVLYRLRHRRGEIIPIWPEGKSESEGKGFLPLVLRPLNGLALDIDGIVRRLGQVGPARPVPAVGAGWDSSAAMDGTRLLKAIYRPISRRTIDVPPSTFLRPEHAIVPFHGRDRELLELDQWCQGGGIRVRLVHGAGGVGKTRLAMELAARRGREGWRTGPLVDSKLPDENIKILVQDSIPLLLIIDYAETRINDVSRILGQASEYENNSIRILLLARREGDWVEQLSRSLPGFVDYQDNSLELKGELTVSVSQAAQAFAEYLNKEVPENLPPDQETPLESQIGALLAVLGFDGFEGQTIKELVHHEIRYLTKRAEAKGVTQPIWECLPDAMALVTLVGGVDEAGSESWLKRVKGLGDLREAELLSVAQLLQDLYPGDGGGNRAGGTGQSR